MRSILSVQSVIWKADDRKDNTVPILFSIKNMAKVVARLIAAWEELSMGGYNRVPVL